MFLSIWNRTNSTHHCMRFHEHLNVRKGSVPMKRLKNTDSYLAPKGDLLYKCTLVASLPAAKINRHKCKEPFVC